MADPRSRGFLSSETSDYKDHYRQLFSNDFEQFEAVSSQATSNLFAISLERLEEVEVIALLFWMKCVGGCQAAFLLLELGMATQAQVLERSATEDLFFACALLKEPSVLNRLIEDDSEQRRKQAAGMLKDLKTLTPLGRTLLEEKLAELPPRASGISGYEAAEIAGLLEFYQTVFRGFSMLAAHGTLASLDGLVESVEGQPLKLVFGPSHKGVSWTVGIAKSVLQHGANAFAALGR